MIDTAAAPRSTTGATAEAAAHRSPTPAITNAAASDIHLLDEADFAWLAEVLDIVEQFERQPWRAALERLDDLRRYAQPRAPGRYTAVTAAVQRILGGRARNARLARAARALVLGAPVRSSAEREARIALAARELEVAPATLEQMLWSDLPRERPIELPYGRPSEREVAALANVHLLQRAMARAQSVSLRIWGDAGLLIRATAPRGLLSTLSRGHDGETIVDIVGPLALFHRTAVYGRALASLVPLLAGCEHFTLELLVRGRDQLYPVHVASPVLLPAVPARLALPSPLIVRLVSELARLDHDLRATPQPPVVAAGTSLVCADLTLSRRDHTTYVELVGFWTREFLQRKLDVYDAAGLAVVLCVDERRGCADEDLPIDTRVIQHSTRSTTLARKLLAVVDAV